MATHGGKGDKPRPVDKDKFDNNWDWIFGCKCEEPKPREHSHGPLCTECWRRIKNAK